MFLCFSFLNYYKHPPPSTYNTNFLYVMRRYIIQSLIIIISIHLGIVNICVAGWVHTFIRDDNHLMWYGFFFITASCLFGSSRFGCSITKKNIFLITANLFILLPALMYFDLLYSLTLMSQNIEKKNANIYCGTLSNIWNV